MAKLGSGRDGARRGHPRLAGGCACSGGRTQSHSDTAFPPPADLLAEYCAWLPQAMHANIEKAWPPTSDL